MKIFISYGRRDGAGFANRLTQDLRARGHDVWIDHERIPVRADIDWQAEIQQGIAGSDVVVAIMTPHAIRGAGRLHDEASTCLDEIAFARFSSPPVPLLPVMLRPCTPPLAVFRLQFVDATKTGTNDVGYAVARDAILAALEQTAAGHVREMRQASFPAFDFDPLVTRRRKDFVGRTWLFDEITAWTRAGTDERALLVSGDPGIGKTAIIAQLAFDQRCGPVLAAHFCRTDRPDTGAPLRFAMHVAANIADRFPAVASWQQDRAVAPGTTAAQFWEEEVVEPLNRLPRPAEGVHLLLVDALDEALLRAPPEGSIVDLLAASVELLPEWVRVVATSRRDTVVVEALSGLRSSTIPADTNCNRDDIRAYLEARIAALRETGSASWPAAEDGEHIRQIGQLAQGSFLYATQVIADLERGRLRIGDLGRLPPGLEGRFKAFFDRLALATPEAFPRFRDVLGLMVADGEALPKPLALEVARLGRSEAAAFLLEFEQYVSCGPRWPNDAGDYLRFFHRAMSDWLAGTQGAYRLDIPSCHGQLAEGCLKVLREGASDFVRDYAAMRFIDHALASDDPRMIGPVLGEQELRRNLLYRPMGGSGVHAIKDTASLRVSGWFTGALERGRGALLRPLVNACQIEFERAGTRLIRLRDTPSKYSAVDQPTLLAERAEAKRKWLEHAPVLEGLFVHTVHGLYRCAQKVPASADIGSISIADLARHFIGDSPNAMEVLHWFGFGAVPFTEQLLDVSGRWSDQFSYMLDNMREMFAEVGIPADR